MAGKIVTGFLLSTAICAFLVGPQVSSATKPSISITKIDEKDDVVTHQEIYIHYKAFESNGAYVIAAKKDDNFHDISYWIGSQTSNLAIVEEAAAYAMELHDKLHSKVYPTREAEGRESSSFKALFEPDDFRNTSAAEPSSKSSNEINENATKMILITDDPHKAILELVEFSSEYTEQKNICFIAFNSKIVFLFCANDVSDGNVKMRAGIYLTRIISTKMGSEVRIVTKMSPKAELKNLMNIKGHADFSGEFKRVSDIVEKFRSSSDYKQEEIVMAENISQMFSMVKADYRSEGLVSRTRISYHLSYVFSSSQSTVYTQLCYVFDTCLEDIGMLVWIGAKADAGIKKGCAESVEFNYYVRIDRCSLTRPVTFMDEGDVYLPERTGENYFYIREADFVRVMLQLHLSWTDILTDKSVPTVQIAS